MTSISSYDVLCWCEVRSVDVGHADRRQRLPTGVDGEQPPSPQNHQVVPEHLDGASLVNARRFAGAAAGPQPVRIVESSAMQNGNVTATESPGLSGTAASIGTKPV